MSQVREQIIESIANSIEVKEGYYSLPSSRDYPTIPQQLINPGNVRRWSAKHPGQYGYVDFFQWACKEAAGDSAYGSALGMDLGMPRRPIRSLPQGKRREILNQIKVVMDQRNPELVKRAEAEGRRVLKVLVGQYVDGKYTNGQPPSLLRMFNTYAPSSDGNNPFDYANFVGHGLGWSLKDIKETPIKEMIARKEAEADGD